MVSHFCSISTNCDTLSLELVKWDCSSFAIGVAECSCSLNFAQIKQTSFSASSTPVPSLNCLSTPNN